MENTNTALTLTISYERLSEEIPNRVFKYEEWQKYVNSCITGKSQNNTENNVDVHNSKIPADVEQICGRRVSAYNSSVKS